MAATAREDDHLGDFDPDINFLDEILPQNSCKYLTLSDFTNSSCKKGGFSILNYNIRSFNKNCSTFEAMISNLKHDFGCIVLSETWNTRDSVDLCNLTNYNSFHTYRPAGHVYTRSGGISVLCLDKYSATKNDDLSRCNQNIESCVVDFKFHKTSYSVVALYRPPQGCKLEFLAELENILNNINDSRTVFVTGDFNIDLNDLGDTSVVQFSSVMYSKGFVSLIDKPTRFPQGSIIGNPSILDMIWTNNYEIFSIGILDFDLTDHLPTFCIMKEISFSDKPELIKIVSRPFSDENVEKLRTECMNTDWTAMISHLDADNSILKFIDHMNMLYRKYFPTKIKWISQKRLKNRWMTSEVKDLINKKSESYKKFRRGIITREVNNQLKNKINGEVRKAKKLFYKNEFDKFRNNAKKSWYVLNNLMGRDKKRSQITSILDGNNELTDKRDIANKFADYFGTIGLNLDSNLDTNNISPSSHIPRNPHSFNLFPTTPDECAKIICNLKNTKTDVDHIPVAIFKLIHDLISKPISDIINISFSSGVFPQSLKLAKIVPIHKKYDAKFCFNYRPISCLSFPSKIFEKCFTNRILSFFHKFTLFSAKQFGFLQNRSTQDAIHLLTEAVYDALNSKEYNISISIDLKSEFDTVNLKILIKKLERYGIRGHGLNWLLTYLEDRQFQVGINKTYSTIRTLNIGVPQGSILGPVLFLIYINDLPDVSDKLTTTLFADDTNFSLRHNDYNPMIPIINTELKKIHDWTISNRLTINSSKTEMIQFSNKVIPETNEQVILNGNRVGFVDSVKFLGVYLDNKVNFSVHVNHVLSKISKHAGILYKIKYNLTNSARIKYYNSFVLPYLNFNILHWGSTNENHLYPLKIIQKRIVRTIANAEFHAHTTPLFVRLKLLKLEDLYKFQAIVDTHVKIKSGLYGVAHGRDTRNSKLALPKFHRLSRTQQSVSFNGPTFWNDLPLNIREIQFLPKFKKRLKHYMINKYSL